MQVGHQAFHDPLAGTPTEGSAGGDGLGGAVDLLGVGVLVAEKAVDPRCDVGKEEIGAAEPADGGRAHDHDPADRHSGHPERRPENDGDQHRLADVGLDEQKGDGHHIEEEGDRHAGHALALLGLGEHPGDEDDQGRLHELRGLEGESGDLHPAGGALGGVAQERQGDHGGDGGQVDEEGRPAHASGAEHRGRKQDHRAAGGEDALADGEVERPGDVEPGGGGRAGAELQQNAQADQGGGGAQKQVVGGPPPHAYRRAVGTGESVGLLAHPVASFTRGAARA